MLAEAAKEEAAEYERLKTELQTWTLALSAFGTGSVWIMYSKASTFCSPSKMLSTVPSKDSGMQRLDILCAASRLPVLTF